MKYLLSLFLLICISSCGHLPFVKYQQGDFVSIPSADYYRFHRCDIDNVEIKDYFYQYHRVFYVVRLQCYKGMVEAQIPQSRIN
jgi:hypothetical protein